MRDYVDMAYDGVCVCFLDRVFKFNPKTGEKSVIIDDLCFANGVQLSPDEDFLLVAETTHARIKK